jgi:hypothetical protein
VVIQWGLLKMNFPAPGAAKGRDLGAAAYEVVFAWIGDLGGGAPRGLIGSSVL